ncbi:RNA 3'-terminal phosphate cyclase [Ectopseudomonas composti]|uniref:RNA 3'-terminal phosphate cyclase n=1 Tax=Ectopseudomonas composti TaxID=658457 RepID=UPI0007743F62|nr:RNA 3'-terminal phosphate cyclase [Pseudomonas composti]
MNTDFLELDGAIGGGQILRSALSLSMLTGQPFRIHNIRAKRSRPGLLRQHLTAVTAAAQISSANTCGVELGSQSLSFVPGPIRGGDYRFAIGTAGSCSLVLQTLLPALLQADTPSRIHLSGGTHNPLAPPFEFLAHSWLPLLQRMGAQVELQLLRHGFVPAGGGEVTLQITPGTLQPLHLSGPGERLGQQARALLADVPGHVAERELARVSKRLKWPDEDLKGVWLDRDIGPGNILLLEVTCSDVTAVFSSVGQTSVRAEQVADQAIEQARTWLGSGAAVEEHLADQLLLPLAMAGAGSFTTPHISEHLSSNIEVIRHFMDIDIQCDKSNGNVLVRALRR